MTMVRNRGGFGRDPFGGGAPPGYGGIGSVAMGGGFDPRMPPRELLMQQDMARENAFSLGGIGQRLRGGVGKVIDWAEENPELTANLLGTGMEAFGAYQTGKRQDRELEMYEEDRVRQQEREEDMKRRRQEAYAQILARRTGG